MASITALAEEHGLHVVEDCSQAVGARLAGALAGTWGALSCFSLHPLKGLGAAGDAGVVLGRKEEHRARIERLRNHGLVDRNTCMEWGLNSRLDSIQAAILTVKLDRLDAWTARRRAIAATYLREFTDIDADLPVLRDQELPAWFGFVVETAERDFVVQQLSVLGVEALVYYPVPIHLQPAATILPYGPNSFPRAEAQASRMFSLPTRPDLTDDEVDRIVATARSVLVSNSWSAR